MRIVWPNSPRTWNDNGTTGQENSNFCQVQQLAQILGPSAGKLLVVVSTCFLWVDPVALIWGLYALNNGSQPNWIWTYRHSREKNLGVCKAILFSVCPMVMRQICVEFSAPANYFLFNVFYVKPNLQSVFLFVSNAPAAVCFAKTCQAY